MNNHSMPEFLSSVPADSTGTDDPTKADKLQAIRNEVARLRDLELTKENIEERLKLANIAIYELQHVKLPEMFIEARITAIELPPEGNEPGQNFTLSDYYKAVISAEWEDDKREEAFTYLTSLGHGDLIKMQVTTTFPREKYNDALKFAHDAQKSGLDVTMKRNVEWNTLTSWLKEQVTKYSFIPDLEKIGGMVGKVVKVKKSKSSKR